MHTSDIAQNVRTAIPEHIPLKPPSRFFANLTKCRFVCLTALWGPVFPELDLETYLYHPIDRRFPRPLTRF